MISEQQLDFSINSIKFGTYLTSYLTSYLTYLICPHISLLWGEILALATGVKMLTAISEQALWTNEFI